MSRSERAKIPVKGVGGETQLEDQGGSTPAAKVAQFPTAIDMRRFPDGDRLGVNLVLSFLITSTKPMTDFSEYHPFGATQ
jgi:hypothetical protein